MSEAEKYYDTVIAPVLLDLSTKCKENNLNFCAYVGWDNDNHSGITASINKFHAASSLVYLASRCDGNLDKMLISLGKWHDDGYIDISQTMLGHWMKKDKPKEPRE